MPDVVALRVLSGTLSNFAYLAANDTTTDLIVNVSPRPSPARNIMPGPG